jgi:hypothetical protein
VVAVGAVELRVAEAGAQHVGVVQRRLHRLAQRDVGERPLLGVEHQVGEAERRRQIGFTLSGALEPRVRLDRQQVGEVVLPRERSFDARVGVGHGHEAQLVEQASRLPA